MQSVVLNIIDNVLVDPVSYRNEILEGDFEDVNVDGIIFKGIQPIYNDCELTQLIKKSFPDYDVAYNFSRLSTRGQEEPTFIHTDDDMGDITCLLYLNEYPPELDGTTIYPSGQYKPGVNVSADFNRLVVFDSHLEHRRNIFSNFGMCKHTGRLIRVVFLKRKQN